jgi:transcriptional regulator with XRE-family HTH domain
MQDKNEQETIGKRLRRFLEVRQLSIKDFERLYGVPYRTIQQYLADNRRPGAEHLANMAAAGMNITWLLLGESDANFTVHLPGQEKVRGILAADERFASLVFEEAFRAADTLNAQITKRRGEPLPLKVLLVAAWSAFQIHAKQLDEHQETLLKARAAGYSDEQLVDLIVRPMRPVIADHFARTAEQHLDSLDEAFAEALAAGEVKKGPQ